MIFTCSLLYFLLLCPAYFRCEDHNVTPKTFPPRNTVVVKDQRTVLMCGVNPIGSVHFNWTFEDAAGGTTQEPIWYTGHSNNTDDINFPRHYAMVSIELTKRENAGTYRCEIHSEGERDGVERFDVELIVLDSEPHCWALQRNDLVERDSVQVLCGVNYTGNLDPVMTWKHMNGENYTGQVAVSGHRGRKFISTLTFNLSADSAVSRYVCTTSFMLQNHTDSFYNHNCASPVLNISHPPRSIDILPLESVYHPGEKIQCSSDGNPPPEYNWVDLRSGNITHGPNLNISGSMVEGRNYSYNCTAIVRLQSRDITWKISRNIQFAVQEKNESHQFYLEASLSVGFVVLFCSILMATCFRIHCYKKRTAKPHRVFRYEATDIVSEGSSNDSDAYTSIMEADKTGSLNNSETDHTDVPVYYVEEHEEANTGEQDDEDLAWEEGIGEQQYNDGDEDVPGNTFSGSDGTIYTRLSSEKLDRLEDCLKKNPVMRAKITATIDIDMYAAIDHNEKPTKPRLSLKPKSNPLRHELTKPQIPIKPKLPFKPKVPSKPNPKPEPAQKSAAPVKPRLPRKPTNVKTMCDHSNTDTPRQDCI